MIKAVMSTFCMLIICFGLFALPECFAFFRSTSSKLQLLIHHKTSGSYTSNARFMSTSSESKALTIRTAENDDIGKVATFLSNYIFEGEIGMMQRREIARLEKEDLDARYSERMGRRTLPSALLLCEDGKQLVGVVGLDCRVIEEKYKKFRNPKATDDMTKIKIVPYLANLAVKTENRKSGVAKRLLKACETFCSGWGFDELYLMVDSNNVPAQRLYQKTGYKQIFEDTEGSCVVPSITGLQTSKCTNVCYKKSFGVNREAEKGGSPFESFFNNLFSGKK